MAGVDPDNFENFRNSMKTQGIFSTADLEKEIDKQGRVWNRKFKFDEIDLETYENDWFDDEIELKQLKVVEWRECWATLKERQRIKAEVENILNDIPLFNREQEDLMKEIKKKLGI